MTGDAREQLRAALDEAHKIAKAATPGTWSADPTGTVCADAPSELPDHRHGDEPGITHRTPVPYADGGDGTTRCCGRTPFELPRRDRLTNDDTLVTCEGAR